MPHPLFEMQPGWFCTCPMTTCVTAQFLLLAAVGLVHWAASGITVCCAVACVVRALLWDVVSPDSMVLHFTWLEWVGATMVSSAAAAVSNWCGSYAYLWALAGARQLTTDLAATIPPRVCSRACGTLDVHMCAKVRVLRALRSMGLTLGEALQIAGVVTVCLGLPAALALGLCAVDDPHQCGLAARGTAAATVLALALAVLAYGCRQGLRLAVPGTDPTATPATAAAAPLSV